MRNGKRKRRKNSKKLLDNPISGYIIEAKILRRNPKMKITFLILLLCLLASPAWPRDHNNYVIRDKNYTVKNYVKDGKIYDKNYRLEGYISPNGTIRDRDYRTKGYIDRNGSGGHKGRNK